MATTWIGAIPTTCDVCGYDIGATWVDGRTQFGPWATMCKGCHGKHGVGLGTGKGQEWDVATGRKVGG